MLRGDSHSPCSHESRVHPLDRWEGSKLFRIVSHLPIATEYTNDKWVYPNLIRLFAVITGSHIFYSCRYVYVGVKSVVVVIDVVSWSCDGRWDGSHRIGYRMEFFFKSSLAGRELCTVGSLALSQLHTVPTYLQQRQGREVEGVESVFFAVCDVRVSEGAVF